MTLLMREREKYKEGYTEGEAHGKEIEKEKNTIQSIQNLMKNLHLSLEQAMAVLEVPETDREKYADMLKV